MLFCAVLFCCVSSWAGLVFHRVGVLLGSLFFWSFCTRSYVVQVRVWNWRPLKFIILAGDCAIEPSERQSLIKRKALKIVLKSVLPFFPFSISFECKDKTMNVCWKGKVDQLVHSAQSEVQPIKLRLKMSHKIRTRFSSGFTGRFIHFQPF